MSLLAIGLSHRTAGLNLLERAALTGDAARELATAALHGEHVSESLVLATCNRVEIYAEVTTFHGGLTDLGEALCSATGLALDELKDHLYVHYADRAITHLFSVACGLDSMAVGESQVLGQLRQALRVAHDAGDTGRVLEPLMQRALRVGKRAHAETGIDRAGASLVGAGLRRAELTVGPLADLDVLVVGAGSMSALAATTVHREGARSLTIANRTPEHAQRVAAAVEGRWVPLSELGAELAAAELVISCTGAVGHVVDLDMAAAAAAKRSAAGTVRPQLFVDLGLPRDVDPQVADLPGVQVADLEVLGADLSAAELTEDVDEVRRLVDGEVEEYLTEVRVQSVAPTVVALRARAAEVVEAELSRLGNRVRDLEPGVREELEQTVHRVVEKLLHAPTVRVKELASRQDGGSYAAALRELFDLDPEEVTAISQVPSESDVAALLTGGGPR
ncbi:glutamyl-tRNA reductase [Angustibacter sp. McL0619]|uniref:glutamyl-tRNA reductase n=1 Tax=Angustibacter sp. McL0619 TaxID=3415676 RepID=UPI003CF88CBC